MPNDATPGCKYALVPGWLVRHYSDGSCTAYRDATGELHGLAPAACVLLSAVSDGSATQEVLRAAFDDAFGDEDIGTLDAAFADSLAVSEQLGIIARPKSA